nr:hypothetical protein CFP56_43085 [Quercus suber]
MYAMAGAPNLPCKPHSTAHLITNVEAGMHNSVAGRTRSKNWVFPFWSRGRSFEYIQMINIDENFNSFVETEEKLRKTTKEIQQDNSVP